MEGDGAKNEGLIEDVKNLTIKETRSAHMKLTHETEGRDPNYKHILIEITELRGLWLLCARGFQIRNNIVTAVEICNTPERSLDQLCR